MTGGKFPKEKMAHICPKMRIKRQKRGKQYQKCNEWMRFDQNKHEKFLKKVLDKGVCF